ncbi:MAG TPA: hypothetical protein HPP87_08830 [Planctomycetes bacterium]|nr:hypothetical protein [Planctomycetota bacterium]HIJ71451.1 hypothetical protein [Planctomycetota bacterium]
MKAIVWIIGVLVVGAAVLLLIKPDAYRKYVKLFVRGKLLYIPAVISIIVGVVLLIFARECHIPWVIIVVGLLSAIKGLSIFAVKLDTLKGMLNWLCERSDITLRLFGLLALAFGALILYAGVPR